MKSNLNLRRASATVLTLSAAMMVGCAGRPSILPNSDPTLRKTSTEFAVDSAKRFPYKANAPAGGDAVGRAQVGYWVKKLEIVNNSPDEWDDVEVWLNQKYVVYIPKMPPHILKGLPFQMFYDDQGHYFPTENNTEHASLITKVEVFMGGKMYNVPVQLAD